MTQICQSAKENNIVVVLGFSENIHDSLYISQAMISDTGSILTTRKKIKATHMERTVFGDAFAESLDSVVDTSVGRVGALSCWEHIQPLLKYHTYAQREAIHVAAWPPLFEFGGPDDQSLFSMSREGVYLSRSCSGYNEADMIVSRNHCAGTYLRHRVVVICTPHNSGP